MKRCARVRLAADAPEALNQRQQLSHQPDQSSRGQGPAPRACLLIGQEGPAGPPGLSADWPGMAASPLSVSLTRRPSAVRDGTRLTDAARAGGLSR
ncbi:hypothetical protein AAFF_G00206760 [Aldrovandia affinis]|uniref:Uncharacterized protein n=1 Tax=Aldrovandia affinis TaxID=143900 RepID=A0AAD7RHJ2_9TELE|nr:hypothetical protein AAFF_G00206760 [Aldrovandia affinis]